MVMAGPDTALRGFATRCGAAGPVPHRLNSLPSAFPPEVG